MAAVKAKEKEMKDEKEAERQVSAEGLYHRGPDADFEYRGGYKLSRRRGSRKRRTLGMRSWRRRCIRSVWRG